MKHIETLKQALEALGNTSPLGFNMESDKKFFAAITALRQAIEQAEQDHTYGYAKGLAEAIFKQHFASDEHYASGRIVWGVNDTVIGILTQIDNMVADMVRKPQQAEQAQPVAVHQFRSPHCSDWYDGIPDHFDGHGPYEVRTLYTAPPAERKREESLAPRQPLTDEELEEIVKRGAENKPFHHWFARAIEAAHGIKEST